MKSRTVRAWLAAAWVFAVAGIAQGQSGDPKAADAIEWSKDRKLRRADFRGAATLQSGLGARNFITIQAAWTCDGDRLNANIRAMFDSGRSTWPGTLSSSLLLQHEQTHFDIAEIFARKIRSHLAQLTDVCTRRGGTIPLAAIVEDYQHELDQEHARYDRQTTFGADAKAQWTWTSETMKALEGRRPK